MRKKFLLSGLMLLGTVFLTFKNGHAITFYYDETDFLNALSNYEQITFDDRYGGEDHYLLVGNEYQDLGITFSTNAGSSLFVEDGTTSSSVPGFSDYLYYDNRFLSIDWEPFDSGGGVSTDNDDVVFNFTNMAYAFGLSTVDNFGGDDETITIWFGNGGLSYVHAGISDFFGVLTDESEGPITMISFDEGFRDGDDIGYDNIIIGNTQPTPEPTTILLFALGILGVAGVSRKKTA